MEDYYLDSELKYSVIVPTFNSDEVLIELYHRIINVFDEIKAKCEIIFVDDGSTKKETWEILSKIKELDPNRVVSIRLAKNYGQHNATICGFSNASGSYFITIDDDLEFRPEDILQLIAEQKKRDYDVVYGLGNEKKVSFNLRGIMTVIFRKLQRIHSNEYIRGSSFRLLKRHIGKDIVSNAREFSFIDEFITWYTSYIGIASVQHDAPKLKSRYKNSGLLNLSKNLIYISTDLPLRILTVFGFFMMFSNFIIGGILIYRRLVLTIDVKGYTSIVIAILFSSGAIILCLGVIAEYIGKILRMHYNKPTYKIAQIL